MWGQFFQGQPRRVPLPKFFIHASYQMAPPATTVISCYSKIQSGLTLRVLLCSELFVDVYVQCDVISCRYVTLWCCSHRVKRKKRKTVARWWLRSCWRKRNGSMSTCGLSWLGSRVRRMRGSRQVSCSNSMCCRACSSLVAAATAAAIVFNSIWLSRVLASEGWWEAWQTSLR